MNQTNGISADEGRVIVDAIVRFCANEGRKCYSAYSGEVLRDYVEFHMAHETMAWCREGVMTGNSFAPGQWHITGVGVAWQCDPEDLFRANGQNRCVFNWQPSNPDGRCIFIADVVAVNDRGLATLLQAFTWRFKNWSTLPLYTYRHGKLIYLTPSRLVRLYRRTFNSLTHNSQLKD